jgi:predicted acylesterase/phospholipase RssA
MQSTNTRIAAVLLCAALGGCAVENAPINVPYTGVTPTDPHNPPPQHQPVVVGLAFSGGGTRAAAFAFGVLKGLAATPSPDGDAALLGHVDFVSGVSGGSITAAYFGYRGADALGDFRERFLTQDVEAHLHTSPLDPANWLRWLEGGGVNDRRGMQTWLDQNLFDHQTFAALERPDRPIVWINASDIYNHTPFAFDHETFDALCSDLAQLPISEAVAASAAVPVAFAPIVIKSYSGECRYQTPAWVTKALADATLPADLQSYAQAISNYHDLDAQRYVKLLDGGLVDNYGLAAITLRREENAGTAYAPLTPEQAVSLRKLLFVLVDSGQSTDNSWVMTPGGPVGLDLAMAAVNTPLEAAKHASFDVFDKDIAAWHDKLVHWRCAMSSSDVLRLRGSLAGWKCDDVHFYIAPISFALLDAPERDRLSKLPTSLTLPTPDVDALIAGGEEALSRAPQFQKFLAAPGANVAMIAR